MWIFVITIFKCALNEDLVTLSAVEGSSEVARPSTALRVTRYCDTATKVLTFPFSRNQKLPYNLPVIADHF